MIRRAFPLLLCSCADLIGITDGQDFDVVELSVSAGTLSPAFDPTVEQYDLALGYPDTALEIHAASSDPEVVFEIAGETALEGTGIKLIELGDTSVDVVAHTPSGVTKTYKISVHRADLIIAFATPRQVQSQLPGMIDRVMIADFDGDDIPDLAPMTGTGDVGVMTNNGDAQFTNRPSLPYNNIRQVALRDFDLDGKPDVLAMSTGGIQILRNLGNAMFDGGLACGGPPSPTAFTMFQFDADGRPDLAMVDQQGRLSPMLGTAEINCFQPMPAADQQVSPTMLNNVISGPFDANAGDDLATLDITNGRIFVHRNISGGGLAIEQLDLGAGAKASDLAAADIDGDQRAELVWIDRTTEDVIVQKFPGPRGASYHIPGNPRALTTTDIDGDGLIDIVVLDNQGLTVLHNEAGGTFSQKVVPMQLGNVFRLAFADLDGDGRVDLVTANFTSTISVHLGVTP
jgi:VCBS repeat protein/cadherin-like protein